MPRSARALAVLVLVAGAVASCRGGCGDAGGGGGGGGVEGGAASTADGGVVDRGTTPATLDADADDGPARPDEETLVGDASTRFRDAAPGVDRDRDGPPDPACTGPSLALADVVVDARCAIDLARARRLRARLEVDGGARGLVLRQEAKAEEPGVVTLRLVNAGPTAVQLPLSFHGTLPAFSVLAEDAQHTIYELAPPPLALRDPGQGGRAHFARISLEPGASAWARVTVLPTITRVLGRGTGDPCKANPDAAGCAASRLPAGRYVLHLGQLLTDVEAGAPARVAVELR